MADDLDKFFSSKDKKGSKGRSHGKKKGVRPDDFLSKFGSDAAGDPTTTRAEPISVPKLMQRTQEDEEWKDVEEEKPNEEESDPKKKYEGLRVGMKSLVPKEESEAASSKTNIVSDGTPASPSLTSPAVVPNSELRLMKSKQDVADNTDSSAPVALVSDLTEFPSLSSAASQSSAHVLPAKATPVPSASAGEREPTAASEQEARPASPSQPSPREKPPSPPAVESPASEPPQRVPEKAPEESAPMSLPSKSSGGRYVPPALRRAAAPGSGSSSDLASAKAKAVEEEEKEKESKSSGGGGGGSSYRPPHMRNKDRAEPPSGASGAKEEPTSPLKERTLADIMRARFGEKGKENKREADAPLLPDIGNQEDFPTLAGAPTAAPVPAAAAPGGGAAAAEAVSSRGAWAKLVAPTRREEDELAGLEVPLVLSSAVHDAYAQQALHDVLAEHDAHMRNEFDEH